jgi:orotate phosphoribosyltransferase
MDGVSFWLIQHLSSNTLLLLESWTILSLGLNVEHYADECNFADTLAVDTVECLHNYNEADEYRDTLLWRLARVRQHCAPDAAVLFVVSVASLGNLSRKVVETCRQAGFETVKVVSLFSSESYRAHSFEEVFCQLNEHFEPHSAEDCPECTSGSTVVRINPSTYLLEISATVVPTEIKMLDAQEPEVRDFFGRYKGHNCIWVHRDRHDGARHHMIYVDVQALMRVPEFQKRLANTVEQIRNHVNVVIAPRHPAAMELAERVATQLGVPFINREETELENLPADMKEVLNSGKILIVDDVVITGTRLRGYRNGLQRFGYIEDDTEVRCLVGVARPQNQEALRGITDLVHRARNFTFVEKVFLPDWQEEKCPWCWELRQLERQDVNEALRAVTDLTLMKERRERLFRTADGMQGDIFLHWSSANVQGFWNLGPRSIFASESQVDLFAEIASILQRFRNSGRLDEQFSPPVAKIYEPEYVLTAPVLQPETSIGGRYYATVIVAAILRATQRHDLRSASREQALMRAVTSRIEESVSSELRSEIMFAAANGRLPRVASMRDPAGEIYQGEPGVCEFLRHLLAENYETSVQDVTNATF